MYDFFADLKLCLTLADGRNPDIEPGFNKNRSINEENFFCEIPP